MVMGQKAEMDLGHNNLNLQSVDHGIIVSRGLLEDNPCTEQGFAKATHELYVVPIH